MFAWMLVSKPCSEATDIGWLLSLGADFGNKNKKVNIGKGRDWGWILGEGTEGANFLEGISPHLEVTFEQVET